MSQLSLESVSRVSYASVTSRKSGSHHIRVSRVTSEFTHCTLMDRGVFSVSGVIRDLSWRGGGEVGGGCDTKDMGLNSRNKEAAKRV